MDDAVIPYTLPEVKLPSEALKYGSGSSVEIKHSLMRMKDLDDIAAHIGMNRSAFCTFFRRNKGMTFYTISAGNSLRTAQNLTKTGVRNMLCSGLQ